jgi:hypothetical protein
MSLLLFLCFREVQSQLQEESRQRMTAVVRDEITEDVGQVFAAEVAEQVWDLEIRKQDLNDVRYTVELLRVNNFFKIWWKRYMKQVRLKTAMQNFPSAPSHNNAEEQVNSMLPWRPSGEISEDAFYVGKKARLSVEPPRVINSRQKINMNRIDLRKLLLRLKHDRAWRPLDLPKLVSEQLVMRLLDWKNRRELIVMGEYSGSVLTCEFHSRVNSRVADPLKTNVNLQICNLKTEF